MQRRPYLHLLGGDIDLCQFLELVIHRRQFPFDEVAVAVADVEVGTAMLRAAARLHLAHDGASHHITGQQFGGTACLAVAVEPQLRLFLGVGGLRSKSLGDVIEHEAHTLGVGEDAPLASHSLGDEGSSHRRRPHHARRVELGELHVHQLGTGAGGHTVAVAGVFPGVGGDTPRLARSTGGEDHHRGTEHDEATGLAPVGEHAADLATILQQVDADALHVHIHPLMDAVILQGANQFETGAVADMGQPWVAMATEVSLIDQAGAGAIEDRSPVLQFTHPVGRFLGVDRCHLPLVEKLAASHRVAEVDLPVVSGIDIAECRGHATFCHHGVGLAQQTLGDDTGTESEIGSFDGGAQSGTAGTDHQHVVFDGLDLIEMDHERSFLTDRWQRSETSC